jgi:hypothetical protein
MDCKITNLPCAGSLLELLGEDKSIVNQRQMNSEVLNSIQPQTWINAAHLLITLLVATHHTTCSNTSLLLATHHTTCSKYKVFYSRLQIPVIACTSHLHSNFSVLRFMFIFFVSSSRVLFSYFLVSILLCRYGKVRVFGAFSCSSIRHTGITALRNEWIIKN